MQGVIHFFIVLETVGFRYISLVAMPIEVFVYTGPGGDDVPQNVVRVRIDPSVTSIHDEAFTNARSWPRWSCVKASWKLGTVPSFGVTTRLRRSSSPPHSRGLMIVPSHALFIVRFDSTMALKVLVHTHSVAASSPTLESHPSSPRSLSECYTVVHPHFPSKCQRA
jgi:hypothetical protein